MQDFVQDSVAKEYINGILAKGMAHILNQAYDNLRSANTRLQSLQQERDNNLLASVKDPAADKLYEELVQIRATLAQKEDALESLKLENGQMRENQEAYRQKIDELNNQIDLLKTEGKVPQSSPEASVKVIEETESESASEMMMMESSESNQSLVTPSN